MLNDSNDVGSLRTRIAYLEGMLRARDKKITELGSQIRGLGPPKPSWIKQWLVAFWERLPKGLQRRVEPFADFIDRVVK
jgi:hypothetical protein